VLVAINVAARNNPPHMPQKQKPFKMGELVYCECPPGLCKLPFGLPRNATVEVVATQSDTTHVKYYSRTFAVPTGCVHSQVKDYSIPTKQPRIAPGL
jgi:hypothetical protein